MIYKNILLSKVKRSIIPAFLCFFIVSMLIFSKSNLSSSKAALALWANSIVPTLFPFFIATELLSHTFVIQILGKMFNNVMKPLFNVPGEGSFAFIMGIISGFPLGAKIVVDLYKKRILSMVQAERLLAFTNNSGPLFIIGTIGISFFGDTRTGILLFITHILACITVGLLFRFWKCDRRDLEKSSSLQSIKYNANLQFSNLGEILSSAILNSINTLFLVGGFVVLFSIIISILQQCNIMPIFAKIISPFLRVFGLNSQFSYGFITGLIEFTNGIKLVSDIHIKTISQNIIIASFLLGFSGFSVLLQVYSIISKVGLSLKTYVIGKVLQAFFAALYTYILLNLNLFFNLDII